MFEHTLRNIYLIPNFLYLLTFIYWSIIFFSIGLCIFFISKEIQSSGYNKKRTKMFIYILILICFFSALIGTRLANIFYFPPHLWNLSRVIDCMTIPIHTFHAGFLVGIILILSSILLLKMPILRTFDIISLYVPLGHAIGRVACLVSGCCWGNLFKITLLGKVYLFHNPIPFCEIIANIIIFIILKTIHVKIKGNPFYDGMILAIYFVFYGIVRFVLEFFRDEPVVAAGLTNAQIVMVVFFTIGISIATMISRRVNAKKS